MAKIAELDVVALCDSNEERMRTAARQAPGARCQGDISEIVSDPRVDAVAVCTPPTLHARHVAAVLDAGKHVFVEKPLALTVADCDAIVAQASRSATQKVVGLNLRQHRLLQAARRVVTSGELGVVESIHSTFTTDIRLTRQLPAWRDARAVGGGVISELATHHFDLWRWLLGDEVVEVSALARSDGSEDTAAAISARLKNGALATLQMSERTAPRNQIEVFGQRGKMRVSLYDFDGLEVVPRSTLPGSVGARLQGIMRTVRALPTAVQGLTKGGDYTGTYEREWRAFADTVLRGAAPAATLEDGRAAARIAIAAAEAAATGRVVKVG
jgi:predicted dehydrogenase